MRVCWVGITLLLDREWAGWNRQSQRCSTRRSARVWSPDLPVDRKGDGTTGRAGKQMATTPEPLEEAEFSGGKRD